MVFINTKIITILIGSIVLASLVGFYGGRYWERRVFRETMMERMGNEGSNHRPGMQPSSTSSGVIHN